MRSETPFFHDTGELPALGLRNRLALRDFDDITVVGFIVFVVNLQDSPLAHILAILRVLCFVVNDHFTGLVPCVGFNYANFGTFDI